MNRVIDFSLHKFPQVPRKLRSTNSFGGTSETFVVDLARLYHHYFTDSYDSAPPNPDFTNFEHLHSLSGCEDFRFFGNGPGASRGKKGRISCELGQAFFRYFLYEFCDVTHFAHMDRIIGNRNHPAFAGLTVQRRGKSVGDGPDYLCVRNSANVFVGEAKGRFSAVDFGSAEFEKWRKQFDTIIVKDKRGVARKLKGYIVATQFATEVKGPKKSKVFAEDPETFGESALGDNEVGLSRAVIAVHYSRLLSKLGLRLLSQSLELGFLVPAQLTFNLPIWRCLFPGFEGQFFVGGFFSGNDVGLQKSQTSTLFYQPPIGRITGVSPVFLGITTEVMSVLRQACLGNWGQLSETPGLPDSDDGIRPSNLAWLRDGSISGPLDFFEFMGTQPF